MRVPAPRLEFHFPDESAYPDGLLFTAPREIIVAERLEDVRPALDVVQKAVNYGKWAAGFVRYEAAPAFDSALVVREAEDLPLLWFGLFDAPTTPAPGDNDAPYSFTPLVPSLTRAAHADGVDAIRRAIAAGDVYQVNYTLRLNARFDGDPSAFFAHLRRAQTPCYAADINTGRVRILSASPELFFRRDGSTITTRPMKGTRPRGRWPQEDEQLARDLQTAVKDRAENVMIVDLLRNDLGKIARSGSVSVPALFTVERYPTVWQMTSTVTAEIDDSVTIDEVLAAIFPCGSVTGAPKVAAMRQIAALEDTPRGVYCGAIGYISPNNESVFSVAIRTLTIDARTKGVEYSTGGGVTWSSIAHEEYDEALSKADLLSAEFPTFDLLETMLLRHHRFGFRRRHINRLLASAEYFGYPVTRAALDEVLDEAELNCPVGKRRLRLLVNSSGHMHIEHARLGELPPEPLLVALADTPVSSKDIFLYHKTTHRAVYNHHRAAHPDAFDVLLYNERGELTEFTIGNLVVGRAGELWTPPVHVGLLAGTLRAALIDGGEIKERVLTREDLTGDVNIWLINSVRGWVPVTLKTD